MLEKNIMIMLLKANDALTRLDEEIGKMSGASLGNGEYSDLTYLEEIIIQGSHPYWKKNEIENEDALQELIENQNIPAEKRTDLLLSEGKNNKFML